MNSYSPFIAYAVALAITAVIPGLGVAAVIGQSLSRGMRTSMFLLAGVVLGDVVYLTVAVAGLAAIAQIFTGALFGIKILGGVYLIYLAYKFGTSETGLIQVDGAKSRIGIKAFLAGFAVTLSNPKTIIFYLALLPTVFDLETVTLTVWVELCALTIVILFAVLTPYAFLASKARGMLRRSKYLIKLNRFAAGIIGGAGILILGQAVITVFLR